jgi:arylsulfatase A-like enzyme
MPNIVLITADDLGYGDVSCYDAPGSIPTPNIDALAASGVRMTNGYSVGSLCAPSRAGMLTGRYPQRFGFEFCQPAAGGGWNIFGMPETEVMLQERLRALGYATGLIGKWHLGYIKPRRPLARGFDRFFGPLAGWGGYYPDSPGQPPIYDQDSPTGVLDDYLTRVQTRKSIEFMRSNASRPFFLEINYFAPHIPLQEPPSEYMWAFDHLEGNRRVYAGMVAAMDEGVGQVVREIDNLHLKTNTLVIFMSDNGGSVKYRQASNFPFQNGKSSFFEGGIRVPFIFSWQGTLPKGKVSSAIVSGLDIVPSVMKATGVKEARPEGIDGRDILAYLAGQRVEPPHCELYWRMADQRALRYFDWKFIQYNRPSDGAMMRKLFDLSTDPGEMTNLRYVRPDIMTIVREKYDEWNKHMIAPLWQP